MPERVIITLASLVGPGLVILIVLLLWRFPPAHPNFWCGYRTRRSKKSQEAWDYAQRAICKKLFVSMLVAAAAIVATGFFG